MSAGAFQSSRRGLAVMFPGQGSQQVGMGAELWTASPAARQVFSAAEDILRTSLREFCRGSETELRRTERLQPALFTVSMAAWAALQERRPIGPCVALGHSLGEYAALAAAGALSFADGLRLVQRRGELMAAALAEGQGGMVAVLGLGVETLTAICEEIQAQGLVLSIANHNCPGQIVLSGHSLAIDGALPILKARGAKGVTRLSVSAPFHCALMQPAAQGLREALREVAFAAPRFPVLSNVTGRPHTDPAEIPGALVEQLLRPVQWAACVSTALRAGATRFAELGPGGVLAGLLRRIDRSARCLPGATPADIAALATEESA